MIITLGKRSCLSFFEKGSVWRLSTFDRNSGDIPYLLYVLEKRGLFHYYHRCSLASRSLASQYEESWLSFSCFARLAPSKNQKSQTFTFQPIHFSPIDQTSRRNHCLHNTAIFPKHKSHGPLLKVPVALRIHSQSAKARRTSGAGSL